MLVGNLILPPQTLDLFVYRPCGGMHGKDGEACVAQEITHPRLFQDYGHLFMFPFE